ncbi:MAG: methyltransferase domain-containing protein [Gammaproteobacteria bacterium]
MSEAINTKSVTDSVRKRLQAWFERPLGQYLLEREQAVLDRILPNLFGYHLMQIGLLYRDNFLNSSCISHRILVQLDEEGELQQGADMQCAQDYIPLAADSVDVVVLPHVLEYSANPHRLLREIERILIGEGHLIIIGFNPWSFCGVWRALLAWRDEPPWSGHFFSYGRLRDWFSLLDFEQVHIERFFYLPPFRNMKLIRKLDFIEKIGSYCCPFVGGVNVIVVKKRVIPLTPVKLIWHKKRSMIESGLAEPTARTSGNIRHRNIELTTE